MARHKNLRKQPRDYLGEEGADWWGYSPLIRDEGSSEARFVRLVARRLKRLIDEDGRSINRLAGDANVSPQTIHNILEGKTWCDLPAIWRLEVELQNRLWINDRLPQRAEQADPRVLRPRY